MVPSKEDARRWMLNITRQAKGSDPDLCLRLTGIRKGFRALLGSRSVDPARFRALCISAQKIFLESQGRAFRRMKKVRARRLILDTDPRVTVFSERSRKRGEADLFEARDRERKEEAYLFIRYKARGKGAAQKRHDEWIEVGNRESEASASISIYQIGAILQRVEGKVLQASLYHYHPDVRGRSGSRISLQDLASAARYYGIIGKLVPIRLDFRIVNREGIYAFWGVTFDKILGMGEAGIFRMGYLKGAVLASHLRSNSIPCSFKARTAPDLK